MRALLLMLLASRTVILVAGAFVSKTTVSTLPFDSHTNSRGAQPFPELPTMVPESLIELVSRVVSLLPVR